MTINDLMTKQLIPDVPKLKLFIKIPYIGPNTIKLQLSYNGVSSTASLLRNLSMCQLMIILFIVFFFRFKIASLILSDSRWFKNIRVQSEKLTTLARLTFN